MIGNLASWPPEAIVAAAALLLSNIGALGAFIWRENTARANSSSLLSGQGWSRVGELDQEIVKLRSALDRGRRRENGYATAFELVLLAMKLPSRDRTEIVARARVILEASLNMSGGGGGK